MMRISLFGRPLLALICGIGIAAGLAGSGFAAAPPSSTIPSASVTTLVIRGGSETTVPSSGEDNSPVVLRGSPPSPIQPPPAAYACSAGSFYQPGYGCVAPSHAYEPNDSGYWPYDYGYWPYWGFDGFFSGNRRHRFPNRFAGRTSRAAGVRFAHPAVNGFGHGFAHLGGFAHIGGFGHR